MDADHPSNGVLFPRRNTDEGRLSEEAFLRDFASDLSAAKAKVLYAVQEPFQKALLDASLYSLGVDSPKVSEPA